MKRKRTTPGRAPPRSKAKRSKTTGQTLFVFKQFGRLTEDDSETEQASNKTNKSAQLELIFKQSRQFSDSLPLPYEIMMKIFKYVIETSDHPLLDLFNMSRVAEEWRCIIVNSPILWSRIDLNLIPMTDRNINVISRIIDMNQTMISCVKEFAFQGPVQCKNSNKLTEFIHRLLTAPKLQKLSIKNFKQEQRTTVIPVFHKAIQETKHLKSLTITDSRLLFNNQKWLSDYLTNYGSELEVLNLAMSLPTVSSQLLKAIYMNFCPSIRVLDLSTCESLDTQSIDAVQLSQNMPNLEVLRLGNVSLKKVTEVPERFGLTKLKELSMPKRMRDFKRDDNMVMTLTYGSERITSLDLRGSDLTPCVLVDMPSYELKELHIDDIYPPHRKLYHRIIKKWSHSLEVLSLVKINCSLTMKECLKALIDDNNDRSKNEAPKLRELDLSTSDVATEDLIAYLETAYSLESINLTACRSLPRGCKCLFNKDSSVSKRFDSLISSLKNEKFSSKKVGSTRSTRRLRNS